MQYIAIHSVPRSGSTWLGGIFSSQPNVVYKYQPLFSYAFKDYLNEQSSKEDIDEFFKEIMKSSDGFINQKEGIDRGIIPEFKTRQPTHICYKEVRYHHILENMLTKCKGLKVILLVRNPLAVIYSWYKAPKEFKRELGWNFEEEWLDAPKKNLNKPEEFNGFNKWKDATCLFLKLKAAFPENVYLLKYGELLNEPEETMREIFKFVGLTYHQRTADFVLKSTTHNQEDAYSVYKVKSNDDEWKQLPDYIIDYIEKDLKDTVLEQFING